MDKDKKLKEIFENDPLGLLTLKPETSPAMNEEKRLVASFHEVVKFYEKNKREPEQGGQIKEQQLYYRLKGIKENEGKIDDLKPYDKFGILDNKRKKVNSFNDILENDPLGLLKDDSEGLYNIKHISAEDQRASADFVAKRKHCKDFKIYEELFKEVQYDLSKNKRKLIPFAEDILRESGFYVHNGILLFLEKVDFEKDVQKFKSGNRLRKDGRTRVIFENGTESNMLYRSLYKALLANGRAVSENIEKIYEDVAKQFGTITEEDKEAGNIYILKSKSDNKEIKEIQNLFKIGFSKIPIEERIKNASQEPTYLMADVRIIMAYKCFNMNPQKFEQLLHNFFGKACLNIDIFDNEGKRHTPREWFIAPLEVIEQAIKLLISGKIIDFKYDSDNEVIMKK